MPLFGRKNSLPLASDWMHETSKAQNNYKEFDKNLPRKSSRRDSFFEAIKNDLDYLVRKIPRSKSERDLHTITEEDVVDLRGKELVKKINSDGILAIQSEEFPNAKDRVEQLLDQQRNKLGAKGLEPNMLHTVTGVYKDKDTGSTLYFRVKSFFTIGEKRKSNSEDRLAQKHRNSVDLMMRKK